jgi:HlyD family secretion protein
VNDVATVGPETVAARLGIGKRSARFGRGAAFASVAIVVVAAVLLVWLGREEAQLVEYRTQPVTRGALRVTVTATGNLAPTNEVDVGSELSGIVRNVAADYDDRVAVGQVLAELDTSKLEAQIKQTEAALAAARAKVQQAGATEHEARAQLARAERLAEQRLIADSDIDIVRAAHERAQADVASALASVAQTEAALEMNRTDLAKLTIRSPVDGIVLTRSVEPGQTVAASFQAPVLFTLAEDLTRMELDVDVDEADVGQVRAGQGASFTVDAYPEVTFEAEVAAVRFASEKTEGVVTYKAILYVDNPDLLLRPGMTATADIAVTEVEDAVLVPNAALRFAPAAEPEAQPRGGLMRELMPRPPQRPPISGEGALPAGKHQHVWILRDGKPVEVAIVVGASDGRMTEVVAGDLGPGSAVIIGAAGGAAS